MHAQNKHSTTCEIFLNSNGVHVDLVLHKKDLPADFLQDLIHYPGEDYLSFGWGDRNFYLNTPTWSELNAMNALQALFWYSESLLHVTRYRKRQSWWVVIRISHQQLQDVIAQITTAFRLENSRKQLLQKSYSFYDNFYEGNGSYTCFYTCNTWINCVLQNSGIKSCLWTPFSFRLIDLHKQ